MLEDTSSVCEESKEKDVPDPREIQQKFRGDAYHMAHAYIGCAANICLLIRCFWCKTGKNVSSHAHHASGFHLNAVTLFNHVIELRICVSWLGRDLTPDLWLNVYFILKILHRVGHLT